MRVPATTTSSTAPATKLETGPVEETIGGFVADAPEVDELGVELPAFAAGAAKRAPVPRVPVVAEPAPPDDTDPFTDVTPAEPDRPDPPEVPDPPDPPEEGPLAGPATMSLAMSCVAWVARADVRGT